MLMSLNNKKYLITKSRYNFVNDLILSTHLKKIDNKLYNVRYYDKKTHYLIIATPKIEEV